MERNFIEKSCNYELKSIFLSVQSEKLYQSSRLESTHSMISFVRCFGTEQDIEILEQILDDVFISAEQLLDRLNAMVQK